jgi:aminoglycoside phosphotransferase (APT) family kinase protein
MSWAETVEKILRQHALTAADRLGGGEEAEVYALDTERVLRIYKGQGTPEIARRRREFYAALDSTRVAFRVPVILAEHEQAGVYHSVEERIAGMSLIGALPTLTGAARRRALRNYAQASLALKKLGYSQDGFGEVLAASPIRSRTWAEFILARVGKCLADHGRRVGVTAEEAARALRRLESLLAQRRCTRPELVHGDYYPANVMVDGDGRVTGVIDFSPLTVIGDARMDGAGAVLYLMGMPEITREDRELVFDCVKEHGIDETVLDLYRIFFAFRFLEVERQELLDWCIATIRTAAEQVALP